MIIAVDFDGTIVEDQYPHIGEEKPFATEVLRKFIAQRIKLVLWTMRNGRELDEAVEWCRKRGVEFYAINSESSEMMREERDANLSQKLHADLFIDDRNVGGLPTWTEIYEMVLKGKSYEQLIRAKVRKEQEEQDVTPPYPKWMFWKGKRS